MEVKDWIVLFVPIICNGIIIVLAQKGIDELFLERKIKRNRKLEIEKKFWDQIQAVKKSLINLASGKKDFQSAYIELYNRVQLLNDFYLINKVALKPYTRNISKAILRVNNILSICHQAGDQLSAEDDIKIHVELGKMEACLNSIFKHML